MKYYSPLESMLFCLCLILLASQIGYAGFIDSGNTFTEADFEAFDSKMGDIDGDSDLDIVISGSSGSSAARAYLNDGSGSFSDSGQAIGSGNAHDLVLRDVDNDGDLDLVICVGGNLKVFANNGSGTYSDTGQSLATNNHYMLTAGDVDNDGDIDIVAATESTQHARLYKNDGTGTFTQDSTIAAWYCHEPAAGDVDGDGDIDIAFSRNSTTTLTFSNDGDGAFTLLASLSGSYPTQGGVYFVDIDADGDLDLFEGNYSNWASRFHLNDGAGTFTFDGQAYGSDLDDITKADFGDLDNDGDFDLIAAGAYADDAYYLNNGSGVFSKATAYFTGNHITLGDVDVDGDLDAFFGKTTNKLYLNDAASSVANTVPTVSTNLQSSRDGSDITFSWEAGTDTQTPGNLLTYNLRVGTTAGGNDIYSGTIPVGYGNVGHHLEWTIKGLSGDTYYWAVQTIDSGFAASAWSPGQVFSVNTAPVGGFLTDNLIPAGQVATSTDGAGVVTINFRIKDQQEQSCELNSFEYSTDGGSEWQTPDSGDLSAALSDGWEDNDGDQYGTAQDWSGTTHSFTFDTKSASVTGFANTDQSDVKIRFTINDGSLDSSQPVVTDAFRVDNEPPSGSIKIDSNAAYCQTKDVTLTLTSLDAESMCFSNDGQSYTQWEAYASSKAWSLTDGDGQKRVYVKFKDSAGNTTTVSERIILDTVAPSGTVGINDNAEYVTVDEVTLNLTAADAVYICFSNDGETYTDWETYTDTKNWTLSEGDGQKTVYVSYKDAAGNVTTASYEILLDSTPPGAPILVDIGTTDNNEPLLDWEVVDATKFYELEYGSSGDLSSPERIEEIEPSEYTVTTPFADGTWYWRVRAIDDYGNIGAWSSIGSFTIDTSDNCDTIISKPILLLPANEATDVSLEPTLTTSAFNDDGNCSGHWKTKWKVNDRANDFNGATTFEYESMDHTQKDTGNSMQTRGSLTSLEIPALVLEPGTTYYWKVRYHGSRGNKSDWSEVYSFTTRGNFNDDEDDEDEDGIPDDIEVDDDTDLNEDGIPDNDQSGVIKSVKTRKGNKKIGVNFDDCELTRIHALDDDDIEDEDEKPDQMPFGLIGYKLRVGHCGETVNVKIHLSEPAPANAKWVIYDKIQGWIDYSGYATFNAARDEVTLELKDGGYGDEDHTENKCIIDPSGIGIYVEDATGSSGSEGCFIRALLK